MQVKSFIIDDIHYINFITFNISTLFFSWFAPLKLVCVLYAVKYGNCWQIIGVEEQYLKPFNFVQTNDY